MLQPIPGIKLEKRCFSVGTVRTIELYLSDSYGRESVIDLYKTNNDKVEIVFVGERCDSNRARLVSQALHLASTIANDFETWFETE